ncbi:uncharacterized protein ATNIH1004_001961 [Aspergillus tanneri]|uniref:Uncharacterized protein n=1 Tax=Aspergillus tanneri TaxID=1220188 RepID=A0A5M9M9Z0_9EURO|nr:uncharacterized protein ATNIH1004_001961 [Aspergillus tanneri]KAA8641359.1 hypothetical protein ATNIH1004_001961 [Aspergillus tanneri]
MVVEGHLPHSPDYVDSKTSGLLALRRGPSSVPAEARPSRGLTLKSIAVPTWPAEDPGLTGKRPYPCISAHGLAQICNNPTSPSATEERVVPGNIKAHGPMGGTAGHHFTRRSSLTLQNLAGAFGYYGLLPAEGGESHGASSLIRRHAESAPFFSSVVFNVIEDQTYAAYGLKAARRHQRMLSEKLQSQNSFSANADPKTNVTSLGEDVFAGQEANSRWRFGDIEWSSVAFKPAMLRIGLAYSGLFNFSPDIRRWQPSASFLGRAQRRLYLTVAARGRHARLNLRDQNLQGPSPLLNRNATIWAVTAEPTANNTPHNFGVEGFFRHGMTHQLSRAAEVPYDATALLRARTTKPQHRAKDRNTQQIMASSGTRACLSGSMPSGLASWTRRCPIESQNRCQRISSVLSGLRKEVPSRDAVIPSSLHFRRVMADMITSTVIQYIGVPTRRTGKEQRSYIVPIESPFSALADGVRKSPTATWSPFHALLDNLRLPASANKSIFLRNGSMSPMLGRAHQRHRSYYGGVTQTGVAAQEPMVPGTAVNAPGCAELRALRHKASGEWVGSSERRRLYMARKQKRLHAERPALACEIVEFASVHPAGEFLGGNPARRGSSAASPGSGVGASVWTEGATWRQITHDLALGVYG